MKQVTKYQSNDGEIWDSEQSCLKRDELILLCKRAVRPLGDRPDNISDGWVKHDIKTVTKVKVSLLKLARPGLESFPNIISDIDNRPESIHPMGIVGRILDDMGGPINDAWRRLCCIDSQGREFDQPYFAINGPDERHEQLNGGRNAAY